MDAGSGLMELLVALLILGALWAAVAYLSSDPHV